MEVVITGRQFEVTDALRDEIGRKAEAALKVFPSIVRHMRVIISATKYLHKVEMLVELTTQKSLTATAQDKDVRAAIDVATGKINEQIRRLKERIESHHKKFHEPKSVKRDRSASDSDSDSDSAD